MTPLPSLNNWLETTIDTLQGVLLDIDGVLMSGTHRLTGSRRLLSTLSQSGVPHALLTNDGNHSPEEKANRLRNAGLEIKSEKIISCGHAIKAWIEKNTTSSRLSGLWGIPGVPAMQRPPV